MGKPNFSEELKRDAVAQITERGTCEEAWRDMFDYIEMFYNPVRKHVRNGTLSPLRLLMKAPETSGSLKQDFQNRWSGTNLPVESA